MTIELTGGWSQIRVPLVQSSGNFTAALNRDYTITATATVTDPTPAEGRLFTSLVVNGTATIGGTAYSTAGAMVRRRYHSGAWANYVYPHIDGPWTWTATQTSSRATNGTGFSLTRQTDSIYTEMSWVTGSSTRWVWRFKDAEPGANAGGNIELMRRDDAGSLLGSALTLYRSTGQVGFENGTAALPAGTFASDLDTGWYRVAANTFGIAANGVAVTSFSSASGQGVLTTFAISDTAATSAEYVFQRSRVTGTNGQALSGDRLGTLRFRGNDDTGASSTGCTIFASAAENFTTTARGTSIDVNLVPIGSTSGSTRVRFHHDGGVNIGAVAGTSPGLGVTTTSTALVAGTTTRIGSESARFAGGTIATPTSTDVVTGGGAIAVGATTASSSTGTGSGTFGGGIGVAGQTTTAQIAVTTTTDSSTGTINALANPTGFIRLTGAAPDVRGLVNPGTVARRVVLYCVNATTLTHEAGTASASDRITSDTGANIAVAAGKTVELIYDPTSTRWRPIRF